MSDSTHPWARVTASNPGGPRSVSRHATKGLAIALVLSGFAAPLLLAPTAGAATTLTPGDAVLQVTASLAAAEEMVGVDATAAAANLTAADAVFNGELLARSLCDSAARVSHEWDAAMRGAQDAAAGRDARAFAFHGQVLLKLQYGLAWMEAWHALNQTKNAQSADAWFAVVADKFGWNASSSDAAAAIAVIAADPTQLEARRGVVYEETVAQFADKVLEETAEVGHNLPDNPRVAMEKAGEGFGYLFGLRFVIEAERGPAEAALVEGAVRASVAAAWKGDAADANAAARAVEMSLAGFLGSDDLAGELQRMVRLAELVAEEYAAAVEDGAVVDPVEYAETQAFLADMSERWERIEGQAGALPGGAGPAAQVDIALVHIAADVEALGDESDVAFDIAGLRDNLAALQAIAKGAGAGTGTGSKDATPGPWFTLGAVLGVMLGVLLSAVAFFAYLRRALSAVPEPDAEPIETEGAA